MWKYCAFCSICIILVHSETFRISFNLDSMFVASSNTVTIHSVPIYSRREGGPGLLLYMELGWWPFLISKGPIVSQDTNKLRRRQTKRHFQLTITENWLRTATIKIFSDRDGCERRTSNWKQTWITIKMLVRIIPYVQYWRWPTHRRSSLDHLWIVMGLRYKYCDGFTPLLHSRGSRNITAKSDFMQYLKVNGTWLSPCTCNAHMRI